MAKWFYLKYGEDDNSEIKFYTMFKLQHYAKHENVSCEPYRRPTFSSQWLSFFP